MSKADELLRKYIRTEFPEGLDMFLTYRDMRGEFAKHPHRPVPQKALRSVQHSFDGLKGYLPDFKAFKRRRSFHTIVTG